MGGWGWGGNEVTWTRMMHRRENQVLAIFFSFSLVIHPSILHIQPFPKFSLCKREALLQSRFVESLYLHLPFRYNHGSWCFRLTSFPAAHCSYSGYMSTSRWRGFFRLAVPLIQARLGFRSRRDKSRRNHPGCCWCEFHSKRAVIH